MSTPVKILGSGDQEEARVTSRGELVVGSLDYSTPYYISVAAAATEYEVVPGKPNTHFVITDIILASDKNFGSATVAETITITGAHPADLGTAIDTIVQADLLKNDRLIATGLKFRTAETCSIVAVGTDSAADVTIAGYYISA